MAASQTTVGIDNIRQAPSVTKYSQLLMNAGIPIQSTVLATHLSNQCYSICFRVESGQCGICFSPVITIETESETGQSSFGLR